MVNNNRERTEMPLWQKILIALVSGLSLGIIVKSNMLPIPSEPIASVIQPIGSIFTNALRMLIAPIIMIVVTNSLVEAGSITGQSGSKLHMIGFTALALYIITTAIAALIGLTIALLTSPGVGLESVYTAESAIKGTEMSASQAIVGTLVGSIPSNIIKAMAENNALQMVVSALVIGIAINKAGAAAQPLRNMLKSMSLVVAKMVDMVISYSYIGVFCITTVTVTVHGGDMIVQLMKLMLIVYTGSILHVLITYSLGIYLIGGMSPLFFFRGVAPAMMFAYASSSSLTTLPITLETTKKSLKVSDRVANFTLPLGSSVNMDGTCLHVVIVAIFLAQFYSVPLGLSQYITLCFTASIISIGVSGIPGASVALLPMVLASVGVPVEGVGIVLAVDRFLDMMRSSVNVCGDAFVCVLVEKLLAVKQVKLEPTPVSQL